MTKITNEKKNPKIHANKVPEIEWLDNYKRDRKTKLKLINIQLKL